MRRLLQRGEIATIVAIGTLLVIGATSLVSSLLLKERQSTKSKAAESTCDNGVRVGETACANQGDLFEYICKSPQPNQEWEKRDCAPGGTCRGRACTGGSGTGTGAGGSGTTTTTNLGGRCAWGDWDCATQGADNDTNRICANMGTGFCSPGNCQTEPDSSRVCVPNKWGGRGSWGCWGPPVGDVCAPQPTAAPASSSTSTSTTTSGGESCSPGSVAWVDSMWRCCFESYIAPNTSSSPRYFDITEIALKQGQKRDAEDWCKTNNGLSTTAEQPSQSSNCKEFTCRDFITDAVYPDKKIYSSKPSVSSKLPDISIKNYKDSSCLNEISSSLSTYCSPSTAATGGDTEITDNKKASVEDGGKVGTPADTSNCELAGVSCEGILNSVYKENISRDQTIYSFSDDCNPKVSYDSLSKLCSSVARAGSVTVWANATLPTVGVTNFFEDYTITLSKSGWTRSCNYETGIPKFCAFDAPSGEYTASVSNIGEDCLGPARNYYLRGQSRRVTVNGDSQTFWLGWDSVRCSSSKTGSVATPKSFTFSSSQTSCFSHTEAGQNFSCCYTGVTNEYVCTPK